MFTLRFFSFRSKALNDFSKSFLSFVLFTLSVDDEKRFKIREDDIIDDGDVT